MNSREVMQYTALQRQVVSNIASSFRQDRQPAIQRYEQYGQHLAALQRSAAPVAAATLQRLPAGERVAVQRVMDEVVQREAALQQQDDQALQLYGLQRQLAELDQHNTKPIFERIQARRGSGNPLPEAVRRHLEQGLNHDLSGVRIHDDAEADKMAKGVNAVAFTTGMDIFFQSGKFNPNTQSGLELLAHEVTHTVQQGKGQVGNGIDPDSGLESEARARGRELSQAMQRPAAASRLRPLSRGQAGGQASGSSALQRLEKPQPSRRWEEKHAFNGELNSSGSPLQMSIPMLQVLGRGVVVGRFTAPNGTGRIDGYMDAEGRVYWTARYETGILQGKERKFHGRVTYKPGGTPEKVSGEWIGTDAQGNKTEYQLSAGHQAKSPESGPEGGGPESGGIFPVPESFKTADGTLVKLDPKFFTAKGSFATTTNVTSTAKNPIIHRPQGTGLVKDSATQTLLAQTKGVKVNELATARPWTAAEFLASGKNYQQFDKAQQNYVPIRFNNGNLAVHSGWDLNTSHENLDSGGAQAKAAADGLVYNVSVEQGFGNIVILYHPQFRRYSRYAHLRKGTIKVKQGQLVKAGTDLATIGGSGGNYSPHLHFDVIKKMDSPGMWNGDPTTLADQDKIYKYVMEHYEDPMLFFARAGVKIPGLSDEQMRKETSKMLTGEGGQGGQFKAFTKQVQLLLGGIMTGLQSLNMLAAKNMTIERHDAVDHSLNVHLPLILSDCLRRGIDNPAQVAYVLATAYHETRLGTPKYQRSVALQEDTNPLRTDANGKYRQSHLTGRRINGGSIVEYFNDGYNGRIGNKPGSNDGYNFRGQGFVQLTGRDNYAKMSRHLNNIGFSYTYGGVKYGKSGKPIDLLSNPEHVSLVGELSSIILVEGMRIGSFRGHKENQRFIPHTLELYMNDKGNDFYNARNMINGDLKENGQKVADEANAFLQILQKDGAWANVVQAYKKG